MCSYIIYQWEFLSLLYKRHLKYIWKFRNNSILKIIIKQLFISLFKLHHVNNKYNIYYTYFLHNEVNVYYFVMIFCVSKDCQSIRIGLVSNSYYYKLWLFINSSDPRLWMKLIIVFYCKFLINILSIFHCILFIYIFIAIVYYFRLLF